MPMNKMTPFGLGQSMTLKLMAKRMNGNINLPDYHPENKELRRGVDMANRLDHHGGFAQQQRMIKDKRRSLDRAMLYSYQAAFIRKWHPDYEPLMEDEKDLPPVRALINPNKLKQDYDDKILSTGFENKYQAGDIFEWCNTRSYWLVYLQDLDELAYFRGAIRRCCYELIWLDEDGNEKRTYAAVRGPVETKIDFIQKHQISVDEPNYSLNILMPRNPDTMAYFRRYSKFYLGDADAPDNRLCWRVEATDSISTPGILEVNATEYYSNTFEDDVEAGIAGALKCKPLDPNPPVEEGTVDIEGDTFIKPKKEYEYSIKYEIPGGSWFLENDKTPVDFIESTNTSLKLKWCSPYSGQFVLNYGVGGIAQITKTIVVESLF